MNLTYPRYMNSPNTSRDLEKRGYASGPIFALQMSIRAVVLDPNKCKFGVIGFGLYWVVL